MLLKGHNSKAVALSSGDCKRNIVDTTTVIHGWKTSVSKIGDAFHHIDSSQSEESVSSCMRKRADGVFLRYVLCCLVMKQGKKDLSVFAHSLAFVRFPSRHSITEST